MKRNLFLVLLMAVALTVGCGGSYNHSPATGLVYVDPVAKATEWKLVKDSSSTDARLVLNLVGPSDGTKYRGVGLTLQTAPTQVRVGKFQRPDGNPPQYFLDGGVFLDKDWSSMDVPPSLQVGGVRDGKLMVGIFQKTDESAWGTDGAPARDCHGTLLQVAIEIDAKLSPARGNTLLTVLKARAIPEQIDLISNRKLQDIPLKVGTLILK